MTTKGSWSEGIARKETSVHRDVVGGAPETEIVRDQKTSSAGIYSEKDVAFEHTVYNE